ncbi:MAG: hypothetical protein GY754_43950 [bacterium]|nr:hypothetical protein [bacterium]
MKATYRNKFSALLITLFIITIFSTPSEAASLGKIRKINRASGEIIVISSGAKRIRMGQKLYLKVNNKIVVLRASYPMMTVVKCRLLPGYYKYLGQIKKNTPIYRYKKEIETVVKKTYSEEAKTSGSVNELAMLCGKKFSDPRIESYMESLGGKPEIKKFDNCYYYSYKHKGISLRFDDADILTTLFLYSEGADDFKQYAKALPENLTFSDSRDSVEKKLGKFKKSGGNGAINFWVSYPDFGISITYTSKSTSSMTHKIRHIAVKRPALP